MSSPSYRTGKQFTEATNDKDDDRKGEKRRSLAYWKSLSTNGDLGRVSVTDELLEELRQSIEYMDLAISDVIVAETETNILKKKELSLIKELGQYVNQIMKEKKYFEMIGNFECPSDNDENLRTARDSLRVKNEQLEKELAKLTEEYELNKRDKQRDIEKLTRVCITFVKLLYRK